MKAALFIGLLMVVGLSGWFLLKRPVKSTDPEWSDLPAVMSLDKKPQSRFLPTPENAIPAGKNAIYAPALLFAWDKIKQMIKSPVETNPTLSTDFLLLNNSRGFEKSLDSTEYSANVSIENGIIKANVLFNKTLPFTTVMHRWTEPIRFGDSSIAVFGVDYADQEVSEQLSILYFKNEDQFILRIQPKDSTSEIILCKGINNHSSLGKLQQEADSLIRIGQEESGMASNSSLYSINKDDRIGIPVIRFNLATRYDSLLEQAFIAGTKSFTIKEAYQRTALILEEHGAVAESEALMAADSAGATVPELIKPKTLLFNKPFFLMIRKKNSTAPYFMMWLENAELLTPFSSK
jgi:hypothetical protein